jgi:hypothetical protein
MIRCDHCPSRTPFRPDPESIQRARDLHFEPPLDEGIRDVVITLVANGVETFESWERPLFTFLSTPCSLASALSFLTVTGPRHAQMHPISL